MAGAGHKLWSAGDVVAASGSTDINTALLQQIVGVYADSSARDAAFGGAGEPTLSDGMICYLLTDEFQVYDGSAWVTSASNGAWSTWTPTISNWTAGNADVVAKYAQFGKTVHFYFKMTMGGTTAYSGAPIFTTPTTKLADQQYNHFVTNYEQGGAVYTGAGRFFVGGTDNRIYPYYFTSTADAWGGLSPTAPFTWATGDIYICNGTYEAA